MAAECRSCRFREAVNDDVIICTLTRHIIRRGVRCIETREVDTCIDLGNGTRRLMMATGKEHYVRAGAAS